ncbi:hypothetical protein AB0E01_41855 [Nocardia vinacea]|uniref:hypothetical protein n=1 Tax=Nocardia vinacea TaxID=96468 RepID=UPI0033D01736
MRHIPNPAHTPIRVRDIHVHPITATTTIAAVDVRDHDPHTGRRWISVIATGQQLLAWIETNLPDLDEDRFGPWRAEPATTAGARTAHIYVRIHSPATPDRTTTIALSATPDLPGARHAPNGLDAPQPDSR